LASKKYKMVGIFANNDTTNRVSFTPSNTRLDTGPPEHFVEYGSKHVMN